MNRTIASLLLLVALVLPANCATTVTNYMTTSTGYALTGNVTLTPNPLVKIVNGVVVNGSPITVAVSNGVFSTPLETGKYDVAIPKSSNFQILVPVSDTPVSMANIIFSSVTNTPLAIAAALAGGTEGQVLVKLSDAPYHWGATNISSTGGGGGGGSFPLSIQHEGVELEYFDLPTAFASLQNGDTMTVGSGTWQVTGHYYTTDLGNIRDTQYLWLHGLTNVTIRGAGAGTVIAVTNYANGITIENCSGVTIKDLKITGSTNGMSPSTWIVGLVNHRKTNSFTTIQGVVFENAPDQAITHTGDTYGRPDYGWKIVNNQFLNVGQAVHPFTGIPDGSCVSGAPDDLIFTGNYSSNVYNCVVEFDTRGATAPATYGGGLVADNVAVALYGEFVALPGWYNTTQGQVTISGNYIEEHPTAYRVAGHGMITLYAANDVVISGNVMKASTNSPVGLVNITGGLGSFTTGRSTNVVISGNTFIGGKSGVYSGSSCLGLTVTGNTFRDQGSHSMQVWPNGFTICDNVFLGSSRAEADQYAVILFSNTAEALDNGIVSGNTVTDLAATPLTKGFLALATSEIQATNIAIFNNKIGRLKSDAVPYLYVNSTPGIVETESAIGLPDGDTIIPALTFKNSVGLGFYRSGDNVVQTSKGLYRTLFAPDALVVGYTNTLGWFSDSSWTSHDTRMRRVAPGVIGFDGGTLTNLAGVVSSALVVGTNVITAPGSILLWNGSALSGVTWGSISGTLSSQTDLRTALDDRQKSSVALTNLTSNPAMYQSTNANLTGLAGLSAENGKVIGWSGGALANVTASSGGGSTNIADNGYVAEIRNVTVLTNIIVPDATVANQAVNLGQLQSYTAGGEHFYLDLATAVNGYTLTGTVVSTNRMLNTPVATSTTNASATHANGNYVAAFIANQAFKSFASGVAEVEVYAYEDQAGSGSIAAEVYLVNATTLSEEKEFTPSPAYQTVPAGSTPTKITFSIPMTDYTSTTNLYVMVKIKVSESSTPDPTIRLVTGGAYPSHVSFSVPGSTYQLKSDMLTRLSAAPVTLTPSTGTISTDASLGCVFQATLDANGTIANPTNPIDGQRITWRIKQAASADYTISLGTNFRFGREITGVAMPLDGTTYRGKWYYITAIYESAAGKWDVVGAAGGY